MCFNHELCVLLYKLPNNFNSLSSYQTVSKLVGTNVVMIIDLPFVLFSDVEPEVVSKSKTVRLVFKSTRIFFFIC